MFIIYFIEKFCRVVKLLALFYNYLLVWNLATEIHIIGCKQEFSNHRPNDGLAYSGWCVVWLYFLCSCGYTRWQPCLLLICSVMKVRRACDVWNPSSRLSMNVCAWLLDLHLICTEPGSCVINVPLLFPISSILSVSQRSNHKLVNSLAPTRLIIVRYVSTQPFLLQMLLSYN